MSSHQKYLLQEAPHKSICAELIPHQISTGYGIIQGNASKQKFNIKSSTEAELVRVSEYVPYHLYLMMFLEEKGCSIKENMIFQDNKSVVLMETNRINS